MTIVELDESVISKRKYSRGRLMKEQWVFGGIQRAISGVKPFFMEMVPNRTAMTLLEVIKRRIATGTTIMTDGWRSYGTISRHNGYTHFVVNNSVNFVDQTGRNVHTQNVENQWKHLKTWLRRKGTNLGQNINDYLLEYVFKKKSADIFDAILHLLALKVLE